LKSEFYEGGEYLDIPLKRLKKNHCPEVTFASILNRFEFNSDVLEKGQYPGTQLKNNLGSIHKFLPA
jgi:hypothetical protein